MIFPLGVGFMALGSYAHPSGHHHECPPLHRGSFNINQYQLYPENAEWDPVNCLVWFGYVWETRSRHTKANLQHV